MGVRHLGPSGLTWPCRHPWNLVAWMLVTALIWPVMAWSAVKSPATTGSKTSSEAKGPHRKPPASAPNAPGLVREIRHWSHPGYTRLVIAVDGEVHYRAGHLQNPDRLYFDLLGAQLSAALQSQPIEISDHLVSTVRAAQNQPDVVRVVLEVNAFRDYHVSTLRDPYRLIIDVRGATAGTPAPQAASFQPRQRAVESAQNHVRPTDAPSADKRTPPSRSYRWHVVIDAGHGGKDPGATGQSGFVEKDIVLDIAKRLRNLMQRDAQWRVTLTRETDVFIPLEERPALANARGADLFVSIHANSAERSEAHGIETYFLDLASDEQSMRVAARENATTLSKVNDLQRILRDLSMTSKRNDSSLLAGSVQRAMVQMPGAGKNGRDLGVKHAPFLVLLGAEMPAILVETGFLSHPGEERKLADPKYRQQTARAILDGIKDYLVITAGNSARQVQR
jgi:N-acetylmuramoyl-L-alanine amidase